MHICKYVVTQVIDMEDGNRNTLLICNAGDNAVMLNGVVLDISGNPANVNEDLFPSPTAMPVDPVVPAPTPDPTQDPTPDSTQDPTDPSQDPGDPTPNPTSDPTNDADPLGGDVTG